MFLKRIEIEGYRAAAQLRLACEFGGPFTLVLGANGVGKATINEAITLGNRHRFPLAERRERWALPEKPTSNPSISRSNPREGVAR